MPRFPSLGAELLGAGGVLDTAQEYVVHVGSDVDSIILNNV